MLSLYIIITEYITHTTTTKKIDDDGNTEIIIKLDKVASKAIIINVTDNVDGWLLALVTNRADTAIDKIYKTEMSRHLEAGTVANGMTKESLVLDYVIPVVDIPILDE